MRMRCAWPAWRPDGKNVISLLRRISRAHRRLHQRNLLGKYRKLGEPNVPGHIEAEFGNIESARALADENVAAIVLEPIQSMAGVRMASSDYYQALRELCDERAPRFDL